MPRKTLAFNVASVGTRGVQCRTLSDIFRTLFLIERVAMMLSVKDVGDVAHACEVKPSLIIDRLLRSLEDRTGADAQRTA